MSPKDGKSLHIVHSLEPLNRITIKHAGVTPFTDQIGEHFAGCACGSMLDLYVSYDECGLAESSHDLTTFQSPFGMLRLVTLLIGWTNSVPIFHDNVTHILQPEIPDTMVPYIDDIPICGPETRYIDMLTRRCTHGKRHDQNPRVCEAISQPVRQCRCAHACYRTRFRPNKVDQCCQ